MARSAMLIVQCNTIAATICWYAAVVADASVAASATAAATVADAADVLLLVCECSLWLRTDVCPERGYAPSFVQIGISIFTNISNIISSIIL